jgi:cytochrome c oxidase assembly protein subunit 11
MSAGENRKLLIKLSVIALGMFGFGFALVPFYDTVCRITGINNLMKADDVANTQVDTGRDLVVEFDANIHDLPWRFKPAQSSVTVHPGQIVHVMYEVENMRDTPVSGQAIPSYGPELAGRFFRKMECFCFTRQTLQAGERRQMPVVFVVDPQLPKDINTITLSYTFFEIAGVQRAAGSGAPMQGSRG